MVPFLRDFRLRLTQRRALAAYSSGNFERAYALFGELMRAQPERQGVRHNLALASLALGRYAEAEPLLLTELKRYGDHYPRLRVLADLYYVWGKREGAHRFYQRAAAHDPPAADLPIVRRRVELCSSDTAFDSVGRAHQLYEEGNRFMAAERWEEAFAAFTTAAELDETAIHALNNAGTIALNNLGDPARAAVLFRSALRWTALPWVKRNLQQAEAAQSEAAQARQNS